MDFALDHRRGRRSGRARPYNLTRAPGGATCAARAQNKRTSGDCKCVTFHRRGGAAVSVWRCENRKLRAHNRRQCRRGGRGPKAHLFVPHLANGKCPRRAA